MTVKVIYLTSDLRRVRWLKRVCDAVDADASHNGDVFSQPLRTKTRSLATRFNAALDGLRQSYAARRHAVAARRAAYVQLRRLVLATRDVLHNRVRFGMMDATRLDRYKRSGEPLRTEYSKMDDWLLAAKNLLKGNAEADSLGLPVFMEPSGDVLEAQIQVYTAARQAVDQMHLQVAAQRKLMHQLRFQVFDLHRELFAWLRSRYYHLSASERREHLRAAGYEYAHVEKPATADATPLEADPPPPASEAEPVSSDNTATSRETPEIPMILPEQAIRKKRLRLSTPPPEAGAVMVQMEAHPSTQAPP